MKITDELKERIIRHEGIRFSPYLDSVGQRTIGIGHAITSNEDTLYVPDCEISEDEVNYIFEKDLHQSIESATDLIGDLVLPQVVQEVIVEMVFQLGKSGVSKFKLMWKALKERDFLEAGYQMRDSKWYRQTPSRCDELASLVEVVKIDD